MRVRILVFAALAFLSACAHAPLAGPVPAPIVQSESAAITRVLDAQDAAWNRGDIDAFMQGYWKSPKLRFASGGTVTYGWEETNARYKTRYATRAKMGTLKTSDYEFDFVTPDAALVHGRWALERAGDRPSGLYSLFFRKIDGDWKITSDTTTSAD